MVEEHDPEQVLKRIFQIAQLLLYTDSSQNNEAHPIKQVEDTVSYSPALDDTLHRKLRKTTEGKDEVN